MSINGIGRILQAAEDSLRRRGHDEKTIARFRATSLARCAMALPYTPVDRRIELAKAALKSAVSTESTEGDHG